MHNPDPVRCEDGDWGFWDETWAFWYGGYSSEQEAREHLAEYCRTNLGMK